LLQSIRPYEHRGFELPPGNQILAWLASCVDVAAHLACRSLPVACVYGRQEVFEAALTRAEIVAKARESSPLFWSKRHFKVLIDPGVNLARLLTQPGLRCYWRNRALAWLRFGAIADGSLLEI